MPETPMAQASQHEAEGTANFTSGILQDPQAVLLNTETNEMFSDNSKLEPDWSPRSPREDDLIFMGPQYQLGNRPINPPLTGPGQSMNAHMARLNSWDSITTTSESNYDADVETTNPKQTVPIGGKGVERDVLSRMQMLSLGAKKEGADDTAALPQSGKLVDLYEMLAGPICKVFDVTDSVTVDGAVTEAEACTDTDTVKGVSTPSHTCTWSSDSLDSVTTTMSDISVLSLMTDPAVEQLRGQPYHIRPGGSALAESCADDAFKAKDSSAELPSNAVGTVSTPFKKGQRVIYSNTAVGITEEMEIVGIHLDDYPNVYYTVKQLIADENGEQRERQTDAARLTAVPERESPPHENDVSTEAHDTDSNKENVSSSLGNIADPNVMIDMLCPPAKTNITTNDIQKLPCQFAFIDDHLRQLHVLQAQIDQQDHQHQEQHQQLQQQQEQQQEQQQQEQQEHRQQQEHHQQQQQHEQPREHLSVNTNREAERPTSRIRQQHSCRRGNNSASQPAQSQRRPPKPQRKGYSHQCFSIIVTIGGNVSSKSDAGAGANAGAGSVHAGRRFRLPNVNGSTTVLEIKTTIARHLNLPLSFASVMLQFMHKKSVIQNGRVCLGELGISEGGKITIVPTSVWT
jgi:hypothetical protein